jgi:hypothetical protein
MQDGRRPAAFVDALIRCGFLDLTEPGSMRFMIGRKTPALGGRCRRAVFKGKKGGGG